MGAAAQPDAARPDPIALWVVPVGDLGGVARHVLDVARVGLPGYRLIVLCPEGSLAERLRDGGHAVLVGAFGPSAGVAESVRTLRRTIKALRPTVVHSHLAYADIVAAVATRGLPVRLVSTEHGIAPDDAVYHGSSFESAAMARVHQARCHAFDVLIAVCDSTRDVMRSKWHVTQPIQVVLNGVDRPTHQPPRAPGLRFLSLARLAPEKRLDDLLRAFADIHRSHPDATLTLAGSGPLLTQLQRSANDLDLGAAVTFPGHIDAAEALRTHDVVVQLSVWENCSYTLLDAAATGLGVVATPVGGNPEILPPHCLVETPDVESVANAMSEQAVDPARRPWLAPGWPTVADMTAGIATTYERIGA